MNTFDAIFSRKSIRSYTGEPVTDEQLQRILLAANAAPIAMGKFDAVHLTVITNPELLDRINVAGGTMFGDPARKVLYGAPTLVVVSAVVPEELPQANVAFSNAAIVVENMALAATDLGVGNVLIWGAIRAVNLDADLVAALGLPEGFTPCCALAIGQSEEAFELREVPADKISQDVIA